jgi:hypothetical protein
MEEQPMTRNRLQRMILGLTLVAAMSVNASAQEEPATQTTQTTSSSTADVRPTYANSEETRVAFQEVLGKYPPQVSKVLKLDPTLFANSSYLTTYPELAAFVAKHPEVAHNSAFFLESVWISSDVAPLSSSERQWHDTMEGIQILMVMLVIIGTIAWLIRTLIEHRRWSRLSRTQAEVHGKLMDRLTSNEDLLAYMQTPGGKRFFESAPIQLDAGPRTVTAPVGRMLWSVQVGVILAMGGFGLQFVSRSIEKSISPPLLTMGVLAVAVGLGFLLSAGVSFFLSKRLGLFEPGGTAPTE